MAKPVIQLMLLWQTIPIAMLMFIPFAGLNLRLGKRHSGLISLLYTLFGCAALVILGISADRQGDIVLCSIWLVALLVAYFSGWACAVCAPACHKLLVLTVMLHCAAMLNATSVSFMSLLLDMNRLAEIHTGEGILFLLCLLAAVWLLIFYFLRRVLRKRIPFLGDQEAKRGFVYQCVIFVLFCLTVYDPFYRFQVRQPLSVIPLAVADLAACMIFFFEKALGKRAGQKPTVTLRSGKYSTVSSGRQRSKYTSSSQYALLYKSDKGVGHASQICGLP